MIEKEQMNCFCKIVCTHIHIDTKAKLANDTQIERNVRIIHLNFEEWMNNWWYQSNNSFRLDSTIARKQISLAMHFQCLFAFLLCCFYAAKN